MFDYISTTSLMLSLLAGSFLGYLIGFKFKRPRTKRFFIFSLVILLLSPSLMVRTVLFGSANNGQLEGIYGSPFIMAMTFVIIICYLLRTSVSTKATDR